jgi:hypothetical protein
MDALLAHYRHPKDRTMFDYYRFAMDLEDVPSFANAEAAPRPAVFPASSLAPVAAELPPKVLALTEATLARLRLTVARLRMDIKTFFKAHDRSNNGTCAPPKFGSVLTSCGLTVSAAEIAALVTRFSVSETAVNYVAFLSIITAPLPRPDSAAFDPTTTVADTAAAAAPGGYSPSASTFSPAKRDMQRTAPAPRSIFDQPVAAKTDIFSVLRKAHALLSAARVQIDPCANFFRDFDPLNKGAVEDDVFRRVLTAGYALALSPAEVSALVGQYLLTPPGARPSAVDYRAFVADVAIAAAGGDVFALERAPTRELVPPAAAWSPREENAAFAATGSSAFDAAAAAAAAAPSSSSSSASVDALVAALAVATFNRRLDLEPSFSDRDPLRRGCVNHRQFQTVLSEVPAAVAFAAADWAVLTAAFQKGSLGVDYRAFLAALRAQEAEVRGDHDRSVASAQARGLASYELPPSAAVAFAAAHAHSRARPAGAGPAGRDGGAHGGYGYTGAAATAGGLQLGRSETGPRAHDPFPEKIKRTVPRTDAGYYTSDDAAAAAAAGAGAGAGADASAGAEEEAALRAALAARAAGVIRKIRAQVQAKRLPLRVLITPHDRTGSGAVDANRLWSVLSTHGVQLLPDELELVAAVYGHGHNSSNGDVLVAVPRGGAGARVDYRQLLADVE